VLSATGRRLRRCSTHLGIVTPDARAATGRL
jgi:hypothetical protein